MVKLILLSLLVATIAIPVSAARVRHPVRGMKLALVASVAFFVLWLVAMRLTYGRLAAEF